MDELEKRLHEHARMASLLASIYQVCKENNNLPLAMALSDSIEEIGDKDNFLYLIVE
jgi:hypothetical protein